MPEPLFRYINENRDSAIDLMLELTAIPALSPRNGGIGEGRKADLLRKLLAAASPGKFLEFPLSDINATPPLRPNFVFQIPGRQNEKALWIVNCLDVEPVEELSLWEGDPFEPYVKEGRIFGRGAENNNQDIVATLLALRGLRELGIEPANTLRLLFLSDEKGGSSRGLKQVFQQAPHLFGRNDLYLVADGGSPDGLSVGISEKSLLWYKFTLRGKATHASTPHLGKNALRASAVLMRELDHLMELFPLQDPIFTPPYSTFEPTLKEKNVPGVNMIPGLSVFYMDCRILPDYPLENVEEAIGKFVAQVEDSEGVSIEAERVLRLDSAPKTSEDAPVVGRLLRSLREVGGREGKMTGLGSTTPAAFFRKQGLAAASWRKVEMTAHSPNESALIDNLLYESKVFAWNMEHL